MSFALQGLNFASDINLPPTHPFRPSVCILVCLSACKSACTSNISLSTSALVCAPSPHPPFNSTVRRHVQWSTLKGLFSEKRFLGKLSLSVPYIKPMGALYIDLVKKGALNVCKNNFLSLYRNPGLCIEGRCLYRNVTVFG
jgi:hypothetical protein